MSIMKSYEAVSRTPLGVPPRRLFRGEGRSQPPRTDQGDQTSSTAARPAVRRGRKTSVSHNLRRLQCVLDANQLPCGAVISSSGEVVARVGDFAAFASAGLVSELLGPQGSTRATFDSLKGQMLPCMWGQGEEFAFVDKPTAELAVVVF